MDTTKQRPRVPAMSSMDVDTNETPARHMCHCGKSFLRKEHLRRHQATHGGRSFVCQICQRSFTRNDLLRRHVALHDTAPSSAPRSWKACDACHENKTKCDGGGQCSLCTKRRIPCTYNRGQAANDTPGEQSGDAEIINRLRKASTTPTPTDKHTDPSLFSSLQQDAITADFRGEDKSGSTTPTQFNLRDSASALAVEGIKGFSEKRQEGAAVVRTGLRTVLRVISPNHARAIPTESPPPAEEVKEWLSNCLKVYFRRFHERWTIIHAPVFDERTDDAHLVGTTVMVGSWLRDSPHIRDANIEIHVCMMAYLFMRLNAFKDDRGKSRPWPLGLYQVALLNIAFAFETGRVPLISRASRLLAVVVASMRENDIFNPEAVVNHQVEHHPGTFVPWIHAGRSQWGWLALHVMKLDAYMALLNNQPPLLYPEELLLSVTETFSVWNAHGLDMYYKRSPIEPTDRNQCRMSDMARSPRTEIPSGTLVEDVQLGLNGMVHSIWRLAQLRRHGNPLLSTVGSTEFELLGRQLEAWKFRLDGISNALHSGQSNLPATSFLLNAYSGFEEPGDANWEQPVIARISAHIFNTTMMYHLLGLHLFADVRTITLATTGSKSLGQLETKAFVGTARIWDTVKRWASSAEARTAIMHSISVLNAYENAVAVVDSPDETLDPIAHVALSIGALVLRAWIASSIVACSCGSSLGFQVPALDREDMGQRDHWIQNGGMVAVDGAPLCLCALDAWMARFMTCLSRGAQSWEMMDSLRGYIDSPLDFSRT